MQKFISKEIETSFNGRPNKVLDIDKEIDVDWISGKSIVHWGIECDFREWGIKDISLSVDKIETRGEIEYYEADDIECEDKQYKDFEISEFKIINELEFTKDFCQPNEVEVDFMNKTFTIR